MCRQCETCEHFKGIPMVCRGVMDCDPPEWYCELERDESYDDTVEECEKYVRYDEWQEEADREYWEMLEWDAKNDR